MDLNQRLKLFMLLLGCKPPGRHVEQHDVFFGISASLNDLVPAIRSFWPEPEKIHIDAWREVNTVDGYKVSVLPNETNGDIPIKKINKLFFINLGGYLENRFEEQHYILLTVKADRGSAFKAAKETVFFQHNTAEGANSHIDDKYGIDVDDIYEIEDILSPLQKQKYRINLVPSVDLKQDEIHLGYLKLSMLE